ncbi:MAG: hypothetical protein LBH29_01060 [Elusimicrobiota bacterium]|jgi:uridine phosphorylase|nr:hypothetical protein [Elusimicrobiota bacterium]
MRFETAADFDFKNYFGIDRKEIKPNCILCHIFDLPLFSNEAQSGLFFKSANTGDASIIGLKNNFLAGDAVLCLKKTNCKRIILFGSCGGICGIDIGDIIAAEKSYNFESFSDMLNGKCGKEYIYSTPNLLSEICKENQKIKRKNADCAASLLLENYFLSFFKSANIGAIDMESSIVFSAAKEIEVDFSAIMYATDFVGNSQSFPNAPLDIKTKKLISRSRKEAAETLKRLVKNLA